MLAPTAPVSEARAVPFRVDFDLINVILNMMSHMQWELRDLRKKRGGSASVLKGKAHSGSVDSCPSLS
jgi:hypothetical protein